MVETVNEEKRRIKNLSKTKGKAAIGFLNGKLYRGYNSNSKKINKYKTNKKQDYKNNNKNIKTNKTNTNPNNTNKISIKVFLIALSILLIGVTAYAIYSEVTKNSETENETIEDVRNEHLTEGETLYNRNLDTRFSDYGDDNQNVIDSEDDELNIPDPLLDDPDSENNNTVDLSEVIESEEDTTEIFGESESTTDYEEESITTDYSYSEEVPERTTDITTTENDLDNVGGEAVFFISKIEGDYGVVGYPLKPEVSNLPLKDKIKVLAKLLIRKPQNRNILTMIPEDTKFLGFKLIQRTLYLNFNEAFNYNSYGLETDIQQIAQIVYTFTSLKEIDKVSFMINGEYTSSIGNHGIQNKEWTEEEISALF